MAHTNCAIAKLMPATIAAGQVCWTPRLPSTTPTRISGTISARNGVWRPTIPPRSSSGSSVWAASVTIGVAIEPNATGAVLPISESAAALSGEKPIASSITVVIATGVPKPARPSISAPKAKAMITDWMRWSSEIRANERRSTAKCPVLTVML